MAHTRQSGPDSGLDFQVKVLKKFQVAASSLRSGQEEEGWGATSHSRQPLPPSSELSTEPSTEPSAGSVDPCPHDARTGTHPETAHTEYGTYKARLWP